jgi:hypothetical protein
MPQKHDSVKVALADLVFESLKQGLHLSRSVDFAPAHEPLADYALELVHISDIESIVRCSGNGGTRYFSIKVHEDYLGQSPKRRG